MTEEEIRQRNEERRAKLDVVSRRNMEKCAAFIARIVGHKLSWPAIFLLKFCPIYAIL